MTVTSLLERLTRCSGWPSWVTIGRQDIKDLRASIRTSASVMSRPEDERLGPNGYAGRVFGVDVWVDPVWEHIWIEGMSR